MFGFFKFSWTINFILKNQGNAKFCTLAHFVKLTYFEKEKKMPGEDARTVAKNLRDFCAGLDALILFFIKE